MEIRKYLKITEDDERKINEFLDKYPKLDESELLERVKAKLPSTNIVRIFCTIISRDWQELRKINLIQWDIVAHLKDKGFVGARVDQYLLGLILKHLYTEKLNATELEELIDRIDNYLKGNDRTFSKFIESVRLFTTKKRINVPYVVLQKKATEEVDELEKWLARLERSKSYDNGTTENL